MAQHRGVDRAGQHRVHPDPLPGIFEAAGLGQADYPVLGRNIGRVGRLRAKRADRADIDDGALAALGQELANFILHAQHDRAQIDADHPVPHLHVGLGNRQDIGGDRGVVDRAIEPAEARNRLLDQGLDLVLLGDIAEDHFGGSAGGADCLCGFGRCRSIDVRDHHTGAIGGEHPRSRRTHAHPRTGDNRDFAVQPAVCTHGFAPCLIHSRIIAILSGLSGGAPNGICAPFPPWAICVPSSFITR